MLNARAVRGAQIRVCERLAHPLRKKLCERLGEHRVAAKLLERDSMWDFALTKPGDFDPLRDVRERVVEVLGDTVWTDLDADLCPVIIAEGCLYFHALQGKACLRAGRRPRLR